MADFALVGWISACCPQYHSAASSLEDLSDGALLASVLGRFSPDFKFTPGTDQNVLEAIAGHLELQFGANLLESAEKTAKPEVRLRLLAQLVLLIAVEGPSREEAVKAIFLLSQKQQVEIKQALQQTMELRARTAVPRRQSKSRPVAAPSAASDGQQSPYVARRRARRRAASVDTSPIPSSRSSVVSTGRWQQEAAELQLLCKELEARCGEVKLGEEVVCEQLRLVQADFQAEEMIAVEGRGKLMAFMRLCGDELRKGKEEVRWLEQEVHEASEAADTAPDQEVMLELLVNSEHHEHRQLEEENSYLEKELQQAMGLSTGKHDDYSELNAEVLMNQRELDTMMQELRVSERREVEERNSVLATLEELYDTETRANVRDAEVQQWRRVSEHEQEAERDVQGILEFRGNELKQLELALFRSQHADKAIDHVLDATIVDEPTGNADMVQPEPSSRHASIGATSDLLERRELVREINVAIGASSSFETEFQTAKLRSSSLAQQTAVLDTFVKAAGFDAGRDCVTTALMSHAESPSSAVVASLEAAISREEAQASHLHTEISKAEEKLQSAVAQTSSEAVMPGTSQQQSEDASLRTWQERRSRQQGESEVPWLQNSLLHCDRQVLRLSKQTSDRRLVMQDEARLLVRALQEIGLHHHLLLGQHRANLLRRHG